MAQNLLDVEQVEVARSVVGGGVVEDACCGSSEVVGGDVSESGFVGSRGDDPEETAFGER